MNSNDFIQYLQQEGEVNQWDIAPLKKLFEAFDLMSDAVNSSSNLQGKQVMKAFVLGMGHRTLEQSGFRLMLKLIEAMAEDEGYTDARNEGSRLTSKRLIELYREANAGFLPSQSLPLI